MFGSSCLGGLSVNIGSRRPRRAMPGFPGYLIGVIIRLCLDLANMSVIVYLLIGGNPLLEALIDLIATLFGSLIGLVIGWMFFFDHLLPAHLGP